MHTTTPPNPTRRFKMPRQSMILATTVALIATFSAYLAMVQFGINVLGIDAHTSYLTCGVFELLLITVAVLAREAAQDGRPHGVLLVLTWILTGISGFFAAWDEIYLGHGIGAATFRFLVPIAAALGWHLALIGYRHLASGLSWGAARAMHRMRRFYEAVEATFRANDTGKGKRRANRRMIRTLSLARRVVSPAEMLTQTREWADATASVVAMIAEARDGHNHITAALVNDNATGPAPVPTPTLPTPNATATVSNIRPLPVRDNGNATGNGGNAQPVTSANAQAAPVHTVTVAQPAPKADATQTATVNSQPAPKPAQAQPVRRCQGCGEPLGPDATARAKYCVKFKADGTRDQSCKNRYHAGNGVKPHPLSMLAAPQPSFA